MLLCGSAVLISNIILLSLYGSLPCHGIHSRLVAGAVLNLDGGCEAAISCCLNKKYSHFNNIVNSLGVARRASPTPLK